MQHVNKMKHKIKHRNIKYKKEKNKNHIQGGILIVMAIIFVIAVGFAYISFTMPEKLGEKAGTINQPQPNCMDSDGGRVYGVKGTTSTRFSPVVYTDSCHEVPQNPDVPVTALTANAVFNSVEKGDNGATDINNNGNIPFYPYLKEYYCLNDNVSSEYVRCERGCVDGACVPCYCNSCEDCTAKLSDPTCNVVKLTQDITSNGTCVTISRNNVIFNGQGYTITGTRQRGYGIFSAGLFENNTFKNVVITNFSDGIYLNSVRKNVLENNTLYFNSYSGIRFEGASNNNITSITALNNFYGIVTYDSNYNTFINIATNSNGFAGIYFSNSNNNNLANIVSNDNSEYGIYLLSSHNNFVSNTTTNNNFVGVYLLSESMGNILNSNTMCYNDHYNSGNDIVDDNGSNSGANNFCDYAVNWNDDGFSGCTYSCSQQQNQTTCECNSCEDCTAKLSDPTCNVVKLTTNINSTQDGCINSPYPKVFNNKTFDCQSHSISGIDYWYWGIYLDGSGNIVKNCNINKFGEGIHIQSDDYNGSPNYLLNNSVCFNIWDIVSHDLHFDYGLNNSCDMAENFNDTGYIGCTWYCNGTQGQQLGTCYCNSCESCTARLSDSTCNVVKLTQNITSSGNCINDSDASNNKLFDCQGFDIRGSGGYGIHLFHASLTIQNCNLYYFAQGIMISAPSSRNTLKNVRSSGIYLDRTAYNSLINVSSENNQLGIALYASGSNTFSNIATNGNDLEGISLQASSNNVFVNSNVFNNGRDGIRFFDNSLNNLLTNNKVCLNARLDFDLGQGNTGTGSNNSCDKPDGWNDQGYLGCNWFCNGTEGPRAIHSICSKTGIVCTDLYGNHSDYCSSDIVLNNYTCVGTSDSIICAIYQVDCKAQRGSTGYCNNITKKCEDNQSQVVDPDLIVYSIDRINYSGADGLRIVVKNLGGSANVVSNLLVNVTSAGMNIYGLMDTPPIASHGNYTLDIPPAGFGIYQITGKTILVRAYADYLNNLTEMLENNNDKSVMLNANACSSWVPKNIYGVDLKSLGLEAPEEMGFYNLTMEFSYNGKIMSRNSELFEVVKGSPSGHHHVCNDNYQCVQVSGTGDNDCGSNSDCSYGSGGGNYTCTESWVYTAWSGCINGVDQRTCYDQRTCGTTRAKPATCVWDGTRYVQSNSCQTGQCTENWQCQWNCLNTGYEIKVCTDANNCGTENYKPAEESRKCGSGSFFSKWYFWVALGIILIAVILLIVFLVIIPNAKKKKEGAYNLEGMDKNKDKKVKKEKKDKVVQESGEKGLEKQKGSVEQEKQSNKANSSEASDALVTYVRDAKAAGMKKDEIQEKLIGAGWPQDAVDAAIKTF